METILFPTIILGNRATDILGFEKEEWRKQELDYRPKAILRFSGGIYAIHA